MSKVELAKLVKEAYDQYYLEKAKNTPTSAFGYESEVTKFISWLKATDSPKPIKANVRTTDPAEASSEPEGKPNE